ncbi:DNA-3-methyladenine glycosylase [Leifsonia shinshuensis]|uniref:DNA-3-methyladenine glycosylase n=1 Tax=Leifsonia shinshuensis TaxID=150026 RepID=UPI001F5147DD|nr:DNA-3-methyladenine glycosylase [Leifsonia shinshuensis]MCI0158324.1 DNA-3-methyladenine glycosylase [Leifsonia shinshuensis]
MTLFRPGRDVFLPSALEVAPRLLGAVLRHETEEGAVSVRITEVEAYVGDGVDPGSHSFRGRTKRNAVMYGGPGRLYTYFTYGMHVCANVVCSPEGVSSALLLRAGEVVEGVELAERRRSGPSGRAIPSRDLARGPARLVVATGILLSENGSDLFAPPFDLLLPSAPPDYETGPRTGVSGAGGSVTFPWRFWIPGDPTVSPYKRHPRSHD